MSSRNAFYDGLLLELLPKYTGEKENEGSVLFHTESCGISQVVCGTLAGEQLKL